LVDRAIAHNDEWLRRVSDALTELGLEVTPSVGNFVLIHFPKDGPRTAEAADVYLTARGYILRRVAGYGLPDALRMTIGSAEANEGFLNALKEFLR
jgi:histidinol-phosphate aminotransferase